MRYLLAADFESLRTRHTENDFCVPPLRTQSCSCRRSLSFDVTELWVRLSTVPRYRARLEQWIVASLC